MAVLDFSKAFDTMPHRHLLAKLSHCSINGHILCLPFLGERGLCWRAVALRRRWSCQGPAWYCVWTLLFYIHINDLPSVVHSQVRLLADDCLMHQPIYSSDKQSAPQRDLSSLEGWVHTWDMKFNAKKCQVITIARGRLPHIHFISCVDTFLSLMPNT